ncbi:MAG: tetratricopeptide repeat protein [bacterium]|nr:tetratricopeptide repeat protein [bacterium]
MKKIVITLLSIMAFASSIAFAADNFALGKAAFAKKDFKQANYYFVQYLTQNPNDANARYYYAQTLTYLKNYKQAKLEYGYVMQLAPGTMVANYAKASLFFLEKTTGDAANTSDKTPAANNTKPAANNNNNNVTDFSTTDNYLSKAISGQGEINTWNPEKMPIKVYIDMSTRPKSMYVQAFKNALSKWQSASEGVVSFMYVIDASQADVLVYMKGTAPKTQKSTLGWTNTKFYEGYINKADITFYTLDPNYKALSTNDFYNVALHEAGHMLGIDGHSDDKGDIMFPQYDKAGASATQLALSARDVNTFKAMYALDKNPYATGVNSLNRVLGSKTERMNTKLQEELEYAKKFPDNPNSYNSVASSYESQNMDAEAIEYYKKALAIEPMNVYANSSLARIYGKRNDLKNAEVYYKNVIKADSKNTKAYCNLTNLYIKNYKIQQAKSTLNTLLYRNPEAKKDPVVIALQEQLGMNKK